MCRYSLPTDLAINHVQMIVRLLASRLFNKTPKSINCGRTAAIRGCLCRLRQLARPTALYTSLSRIVVEPVEPRSSLLDLVVVPRVVKKSQESDEDEVSSVIFPKRSTNCLDQKITTDLAASSQLLKR
jgi:hypothetical protein